MMSLFVFMWEIFFQLVTAVNERILRKRHELYTEESIDLISVAEDVGILLLTPPK